MFFNELEFSVIDSELKLPDTAGILYIQDPVTLKGAFFLGPNIRKLYRTNRYECLKRGRGCVSGVRYVTQNPDAILKYGWRPIPLKDNKGRVIKCPELNDKLMRMGWHFTQVVKAKLTYHVIEVRNNFTPEIFFSVMVSDQTINYRLASIAQWFNRAVNTKHGGANQAMIKLATSRIWWSQGDFAAKILNHNVDTKEAAVELKHLHFLAYQKRGEPVIF